MSRIPKLRKKISSFLTKEDGKISKENLIQTGLLLSAAALASLKTVNAGCPPDTTSHDEHCNELSLRYISQTARGTHQHGHGSHSSHGSHGSHGSHSSSF